MLTVLVIALNNALSGHKTFLDTFSNYPKINKYTIKTLTILKLPANKQGVRSGTNNISKSFFLKKYLIVLIGFWLIVLKLNDYIKRIVNLKHIVCIDFRVALFLVIVKKIFNHDYKIITVSLISNRYKDEKKPVAKEIYNKTLINLILRHSNAIVTSCQGMAIEILKNYNFKTTTIYNGIDIPKINKLASYNILNIGIKKRLTDKKYTKIAYMGYLSYKKGTDLLLQAFSKAVSINPNILLIIIGTGPKYQEYVDMAKKLNIHSKVIFLGVLKNPYPYIRASDIYIQPNRVNSLDYSALAAMALKKPVIAADTTDFKKLLENIRGELVSVNNIGDFARTIISLSKKKSLQRKMGELAYQMVQQYSINNMLAGYTKLFDKLLVESN